MLLFTAIAATLVAAIVGIQSFGFIASYETRLMIQESRSFVRGEQCRRSFIVWAPTGIVLTIVSSAVALFAWLVLLFGEPLS